MIANRFNPLGKRFGKPYAYEVEYLQSPNTTSYIDLGIKTDSDYDFSIKLSIGSYIGNGCVFGAYYGSGSRAQVLSAVSFSTKRYSFIWDGYTSSDYTVDAFGFSRIDTIKLTPIQFVFNDKTYTRNRSVINPSDATLYLFNEGTLTRGGTIARVYYFTVSKKGEVIIDLIPVVDFDGVPCMYNNVNGELYYGNANFIAGERI